MPEFIDAHGITIVYDLHPAKTTPRAVVQFAHGYGEHAGRCNDAKDAHRRHDRSALRIVRSSSLTGIGPFTCGGMTRP